MVQVGTAFDYHNAMQQHGTSAGREGSLTGAVHDLVAALAEAGRQLEAAAEAFADESRRTLEEAVERAERFAMEARRDAEAAHEARQEIQTLAGQAKEHSTETASEGERLRRDLESRIAGALRQIGDAVAAGREAAASAQRASEQASGVAPQAEARPEVAPAPHTAPRIADNPEPGEDVLSRLVQGLETRVAALGPATGNQAPSSFRASPGPALEESLKPPGDAASPALETSSDLRADEPPDGAPEDPATPDEAEGDGDAVALSGRVLLAVSPVPDFDCLLSLDSALGRILGVRNVTLAEYALNEVTFRLQLPSPTVPTDFADELSRTCGRPIGLLEVSGGRLSLRLTA